MMKSLIVLMAYGYLFFINYQSTPRKNKTVTCWMSEECISCLGKTLPCDCERKANEYFAINIDTTLDSSSDRITLMGNFQNELFYYKLRGLSKNTYEILGNNGDSQNLGNITFDNGSLFLNNQNGDTKYINIGTSNELGNYDYEFENIALINKALKEKGYPELNKTLSEDSLQCDCNKGVNLVTIHGKPHAWVLEHSMDSLYIYKVTNEDADPDDSLIKRKIIQFNWK